VIEDSEEAKPTTASSAWFSAPCCMCRIPAATRSPAPMFWWRCLPEREAMRFIPARAEHETGWMRQLHQSWHRQAARHEPAQAARGAAEEEQGENPNKQGPRRWEAIASI